MKATIRTENESKLVMQAFISARNAVRKRMRELNKIGCPIRDLELAIYHIEDAEYAFFKERSEMK